MTVSDCLSVVDQLSPNAYALPVKLNWLTELEGRILVELHGRAPGSLPALSERSALVVPAPFTSLYWLFLLALMDYFSGDVARYANTAALFNAAYQSYAKYVIRGR